MAAGVKLLHEFKPDIMYLSTTDFIQHKYAPGDEVANTFYAMFDKYIGELNVNNNSIIITLDDNSVIYSDLKIPEIFASVIKKGLPITAKFSGNKNKIYNGAVYAVSSRINAETRSLLIRVKIDNEDAELIPGSLLEVTVNYNERNSLGIPDTSIMLEGDKIYVYKVSEKNITDKTEIKTGIRDGGYVEVLSGLNEGENIVAEGLKKVRPKGKITPIKK